MSLAVQNHEDKTSLRKEKVECALAKCVDDTDVAETLDVHPAAFMRHGTIWADGRPVAERVTFWAGGETEVPLDDLPSAQPVLDHLDDFEAGTDPNVWLRENAPDVWYRYHGHYSDGGPA